MRLHMFFFRQEVMAGYIEMLIVTTAIGIIMEKRGKGAKK